MNKQKERIEVDVLRFNITGNPKNPLGLMQDIEGITWQLVSYFHFNDKTEAYAKTQKFLSINRTIDWPVSVLQKTDDPKINFQMRHFFPNTWRRYKAENIGYGITLLFKRYDEILTLKELKEVPKNHMQASMDYFTQNKLLPLLITDNKMFNILNSSLTSDNNVTDRNKAIDLKFLSKILSIKTIDKRFVSVDKKEESFYNSHDQEFNQTMALLKGGYVEHKFNDTIYSLPLLPLLALSDLSNCIEQTYEFKIFTWFFKENMDIKEAILSDIFIISDLNPKLKDDHEFINSLTNFSKKLLKEFKV